VLSYKYITLINKKMKINAKIEMMRNGMILEKNILIFTKRSYGIDINREEQLLFLISLHGIGGYLT
jgi:hypothetical protein